MALARCPRCGKAFDRIRSAVCADCTPEEEADYGKIRDVLTTDEPLSLFAVAERAGVGSDVVRRMLDEGEIVNAALIDGVKCGRCGRPAISVRKRLCERCLSELNRNVTDSVTKLRTLIDEHRAEVRQSWKQGQAHGVHDALSDKRRGRGAGGPQRLK